MLISQGHLGVFFSNGLVGSIMLLGLLLFSPAIARVMTWLRRAPGN